MGRYAENTTVSSEKSRAEIEQTLRRYGADGFAYAWKGNMALVGFTMNAREVRFSLAMPPMDDRQFTHTPGRNIKRSQDQQMAEYEKAVRQRWRALALVIKAKLEAVEAGITVFEEEFLAHIVMPGGKTVGEHALPVVETAYATGKVSHLLPHFDAKGN